MITKIRSSSKSILKILLKAIETDTRSTTGKNLRETMLLVGKMNIFEVQVEDADNFPYFPRPEGDLWKIEVLKCMLEEKEENGLDASDKEAMNLLCSD